MKGEVVMRGKRILIFGGWGLVGTAICRELMDERPARLIVCSLREEEAREAAQRLAEEYPSSVRLDESGEAREEDGVTLVSWEWGNIFVRWNLKDESREGLLGRSDNRRRLLKDILGPLKDDVLRESFIYKVLEKYRPHVVIDAVNSATALAYQDIFTSSARVLDMLDAHQDGGGDFEALRAEVEKNLCTSYIPQLIRHIQILYNSMRRFETEYYVKIGTSGTGGMGLNIPYTHSEDRPSRVLLSKSSIAGAHTLLLFLMGRTPDAPVIKEFKPTTAIAWKSIGYGEIRKGGRPIEVFDIDPQACRVELGGTLSAELPAGLKERFSGGRPLRAVFIDSGENGTFSRCEFETLTSLEQMEFITPEEIAKSVVYEIKGGNTGHDIINALDQSCMGPTYRAGYLREAAISKLRELEKEKGMESVAFELLGPPRLSKLLFEAHLLKKTARTLRKIAESSPGELSAAAQNYLLEDRELLSRMVSIGIPVLLKDGKSLIRGPIMKVPGGGGEYEINEENLRNWTFSGWVDLREENFSEWKERARRIIEQVESLPAEDTSSRYHWNSEYWHVDGELEEAKVVAWIFKVEEEGYRMKD